MMFYEIAGIANDEWKRKHYKKRTPFPSGFSFGGILLISKTDHCKEKGGGNALSSSPVVVCWLNETKRYNDPLNSQIAPCNKNIWLFFEHILYGLMSIPSYVSVSSNDLSPSFLWTIAIFEKWRVLKHAILEFLTGNAKTVHSLSDIIDEGYKNLRTWQVIFYSLNRVKGVLIKKDISHSKTQYINCILDLKDSPHWVWTFHKPQWFIHWWKLLEKRLNKYEVWMISKLRL